MQCTFAVDEITSRFELGQDSKKISKIILPNLTSTSILTSRSGPCRFVFWAVAVFKESCIGNLLTKYNNNRYFGFVREYVTN